MPARSNNKSHKNRHQKKNNKSRYTKKHSKKSQNRLKHKKHNSNTRKTRVAKRNPTSTPQRSCGLTRKHTQRGGFNSCALATVQEPGFTIPAIGDVPGFSLADSKGAINRPNCKTDNYQAMIPL